MNQLCVFCQSPLAPGERQCQECGRWQPSSSPRYQPPNDPFDNTWEDEDSGWNTLGGSTQQGTFRRGAPPGPSTYQRRPPGQPSTRRNTTTVKILMIVLALAVVGLGGGAIAVVLAQGGNASQGRPVVIAASATPTDSPTTGTPTTTPSPGKPTTTPSPGKPSPTPTPTRAQLCAPHSTPPIVYRIGPTYGTNYFLIPDDLPLTPVTLDQAPRGGGIVIGNKIDVVAILNTPPVGKTITICKMTLTLTAFTPLAGSVVNIWNDCESVWYNPGGLKDPPCGGNFLTDGEAAFTIGTPEVGASMTSTVHYPNKNNSPGLVSASSPGLGFIEGNVQVTVSGTYSFTLGLWTDDSSGPTFGSKTIKILVLIGQPSHVWSGKRCEASDMQAQLPPPTDPPGKFICPGPPSGA